jgi:hypothetical protein
MLINTDRSPGNCVRVKTKSQLSVAGPSTDNGPRLGVATDMNEIDLMDQTIGDRDQGPGVVAAAVIPATGSN